MEYVYESDSDLEYVYSDSDNDMPTAGGGGASPRGRGRGRGGNKSLAINDGSDTQTGNRGGNSAYRRRAAARADNVPITTELIDPEEKLIQQLRDVLVEHSRQRLRATHMSLRRYGTVENRISQKDLQQAFQENQIKLSNRLLQMMTDIFEDHAGVDYERLHKCLMVAHMKTGRDSVRARLLRNDLSHRPEVSKEQKDNDFLRRLEEQLIKERTFFDIEVLRKEFQSKDSSRTGKIPKESMFFVCEMRTPLYGALLKNLLNRCDEDKNEMISWPEFLNFLEKSQERAWKKCPDLAELPEKTKQAALQIASNPIDELSSGAKSRVVSRLLKKKEKSSLSREPSNITNGNVNQEERVESNLDDSSSQLQLSINSTNLRAEPDLGTTTNQPSAQTPQTPTDQTNQEITNKETTKDNAIKETKKDPEETKVEPPVIEVDKASDDISASTPEHHSLTEVSVKSPTPEPQLPAEPDIDDTNVNSVTLDVHGRKVKVIQPEGYKDSSLPVDPPQERLQLDWVYGYRGNDCRSNIYILGNDDIVYFISNVAVLYNRENHTQRHYREHTEDIKSLAVHSNGNIVATGQFASKRDSKSQAHIRVWRVDTLMTMHVLGLGAFNKAVMCLAFQKDSDYLAAVDNCQEKKLSLWNVSSGSLVAETVLHCEVICDIGFNPVYTDLVVSIGKEHLAWWKVYPESNKIQTHAAPQYDNYLRAKFVICLTHTERGDLITGDSNGTIYVWGDGGNKITNFVKHGHDGPVFTVIFHRQHLVSGGRDGMMYCWQWTRNMDCDGKIQISRSEGGVRMIQQHRETFLIGTTMNSLLSILLAPKGSPLDGAELEMLPLTQGHFDELRGLSTIPESFIGADFLTAGTDGIICKFNSDKHQPVWKIVMKGTTFLCADCSRDGKLTALGTHDGHLVILGLVEEDLSVVEIFNKKISKDRLDAIRLAPDNQMLAVGGHDKAVYVFSLQEKEEPEVKAWEMIGKCKGHRGPITALDWSKDKVKDTFLLRSSSSVPEQFFWNPLSCQREEGKTAVSLDWCSNTCTLDYSLTGIWSSKQAKEAHVNSVDINPRKSVIAMGDNSGCLSLFRYPCPKDGAFSHTYKCHLNVQTVRFSSTGNFILTAGGRDSCIMQWKLV